MPTALPAIPPALDHVVLATPDLAGTVAEFTERTGTAPVAGGVHPDRGTRNYLVGFDARSYLEIIGPDPERTVGSDAMGFGLATLAEPRVMAWAVHPVDIVAARSAAAELGHDTGEVRDARRRTAEGRLLEWRMTDAPNGLAAGIVPFLIDWGTTPHPANGIPRVDLVAFAGRHPDADTVRSVLAALGTGLRLETGPTELVLTVAGQHGPIEFH
jgi:glyoxalase-like protein